MKIPWTRSIVFFLLSLAFDCRAENVPSETQPAGLHFTLPEAEAYALQNHPQIASARLTADAVRQQIREARSAFFPQVYGEATSVYAPYDEKTGESTRASALVA